ncbi:hypothetical protein RSAG8_08916, partial [Rhizoctonia solani AG-8 WAC10335]
MPLRTYACPPFRPARDRQTLGSRFPLVISSQPTPQPGMIIGPPSESCLEKDLLQDAQRLRGGGLCGCCGGGDPQRPSPLEPQPSLAGNKTTTEQATPKAPANQQVPLLSQPTPPKQASQTGPSEKTPSATKSTGATLAAPSRSSRTISSPASPPPIPPVSQPSGQSRPRHKTLPSKLSANQPTQASSLSSSPILEGTIDYGGGVMRSPAFPPSVHVAGGSRKAAGGPPPITAPFMKD